jgi:hypothetical protein
MMTKKLVLTLTGLMALAIATTAAAASVTMLPGLWKTTGIGTNNGKTERAHSSTSCVTQKDIDGLADSIAHPKLPPGTKCTRTAFKQSPTGVEYKYECMGVVKNTQTGSFKFISPTHYVGTVKMSGDVPGGQPFENFTTIEGVRVGDCPAKAGATH